MRRKRGVSTKAFVLVLALVLVFGAAVGGTLAWITDKTDSVTNTFTVGDINITLTESDNLDLKMVPGNEIAKDPKVTVKTDSEACWLFIKVAESANFDDFMTYTIADGWTALSGETGVYYREVAFSTSDQPFQVLKAGTGTDMAHGCVAVKDTVTKQMLTADGFTKPTLTFTAYACQKDNIGTAALAWQKLNPST